MEAWHEVRGDAEDACPPAIASIGAARVMTGRTEIFEGDYFFSTMPVRELIGNMDPTPPANVREVAEGLVYRDFITVGLLVSRLSNSVCNFRDRPEPTTGWQSAQGHA